MRSAVESSCPTQSGDVMAYTVTVFACHRPVQPLVFLDEGVSSRSISALFLVQIR